jgi:hypothetical protein
MQAWHLRADGSWTRRTPQDGEEAHSSQEVLMRRSQDRVRAPEPAAVGA